MYIIWPETIITYIIWLGLSAAWSFIALVSVNTIILSVKCFDYIDISIIFVSINKIVLENLNEIVFYSLDKAIRMYRQYAHQQLSAHGFDVTIDQWLILKSLNENPDCPQQQIAGMTFKDYASLTRIIELLVKKGYLERAPHPQDRRRFTLTLTDNAHQVLKAMQTVIVSNRKHALAGISKSDIDDLQKTLDRIIQNCSEP